MEGFSISRLRSRKPFEALILFSILIKSFLPNIVACQPVRPDWAIYRTLGNISEPVATISLPKPLTFLGNFCKGVKIFNFF